MPTPPKLADNEKNTPEAPDVDHRSHKLLPNPANGLFDPLPDDVYAALKADIAARGLLNPILCTPDFTVIAGHHRLKAAMELSLESGPVEIHDVDAAEAESQLIAANVLRRQLNPMEQARLIKRLKERYHVQPGPRGKGQGTANPVNFTGIAQTVGVDPETAHQLDRLNKLVPPLQELVSAGKLGTSHGVALAALDPEHQQALYDVIGESVTQLKLVDIRAAKKAPDTSGLEVSIAALETERERLQAELNRQPQSEAIVALTERLQAAEDAQQAAWAEVEPLRAERPIDRIVQTIVPDPGQAQRIQDLEAQLALFQPIAEQIEQHGTLQKEIVKLESENKAAKSQLHSIAQLDPAPLVPQLQPEIQALWQIRQELGDGLTTLPHRPTEDARSRRAAVWEHRIRLRAFNGQEFVPSKDRSTFLPPTQGSDATGSQKAFARCVRAHSQPSHRPVACVGQPLRSLPASGTARRAAPGRKERTSP